jgi:hypothetical protein
MQYSTAPGPDGPQYRGEEEEYSIPGISSLLPPNNMRFFPHLSLSEDGSTRIMSERDGVLIDRFQFLMAESASENQVGGVRIYITLDRGNAADFFLPHYYAIEVLRILDGHDAGNVLFNRL